MRFLRYANGWTGDVIEWLPACDWCLGQMAKAEAEVARLEALWRARECAADDCQVVFEPAHPKQRYCGDRCRKRTHARRKAAALNGA
jgi:hypothetical protein